MRALGAFARISTIVGLVATGAGALAMACDASLDTVCFDGQPCVPEEGGGGGGTTAPGDDGDIPCDVFAVLEAKCHVCHNANHDNGAPIDLLACSRFAEDDCGGLGPRHGLAASYVDSDFMPLGAAELNLTADEKATLLGWLSEGAPCVAKGSGCTGTAGAKACYEE